MAPYPSRYLNTQILDISGSTSRTTSPVRTGVGGGIITLFRHKKAWFDTKIHGLTPKCMVWHKKPYPPYIGYHWHYKTPFPLLIKIIAPILELVDDRQVRPPLNILPPPRQHDLGEGCALGFGGQLTLEKGNSVGLGRSKDNEFHSGIVFNLVDLHIRECLSIPEILCSFSLCHVLVSRAGDFKFSYSGDISKNLFKRL